MPLGVYDLYVWMVMKSIDLVTEQLWMSDNVPSGNIVQGQNGKSRPRPCWGINVPFVTSKTNKQTN